jgi:hypothetical protein
MDPARVKSSSWHDDQRVRASLPIVAACKRRIISLPRVFAGIFYFVFCLGMTRYSARIERVLAKGRR